MSLKSIVRRTWVVAAGLAACSAAAFAEPVTLEIDPVHSQVSFSVRHLFSKVPGRFTRFSGTIVYDEKNLAASRVSAEIEAASITTDNERRDGHLRSPDFFAADSFTRVTFVSRSVVPGKGGEFQVAGDLTMRGVTRPVTLQGHLLGAGTGMRGGAMAAFEASTRVNRKDFGINWSRTLDNGGVVVGDDVDITLAVEANAPAPAPPTGKK